MSPLLCHNTTHGPATQENTQERRLLCIELYVICWEKSPFPIVFTKPPVIVRKFLESIVSYKRLLRRVYVILGQIMREALVGKSR